MLGGRGGLDPIGRRGWLGFLRRRISSGMWWGCLASFFLSEVFIGVFIAIIVGGGNLKLF